MNYVADWRAAEHVKTCEHPHRDCYCDVDWNDHRAKSTCADCEAS